MSTQTHAFSVHEPRRNVRKHRPSAIGTAAAGSLTEAPAGLVLTTTVPREFVHRAAVSEVLLTGWEAVAEPEGEEVCDSSYVIRAQWPRGHSLFSQSRGYQDPMLLVESVRQAGPAGACRVRGALRAPVHDAGPEDRDGPGVFLRDPEAHRTRTAHGVPRRGPPGREPGRDLPRHGVTVRGGQRLATGSASFTCISPNIYRRLRKDKPTVATQAAGAPIDPATVGRLSAANVLLAEEPAAVGGSRSWAVRIDSSHPIFFDHPVDHIPGMVLLEAARQAAYAATGCPGKLVTGLSSTFTRYAELDAPCRIEAAPGETVDGATSVRVTGVQSGYTVFTADVVLSAPALHSRPQS